MKSAFKIGITALIGFSSLFGREKNEEIAISFAPPDSFALQALFSSLDPFSLLQQLAFYDLYPDTHEGKMALERAWSLLKNDTSIDGELTSLPLPEIDLQPVVSLVTRQPYDAPPNLTEQQLSLINSISKHFPNRKLRGKHVTSRQEVLDLPSEEIDLSRALLLYQFDETEQGWQQLRQYEAMLDLLALQIAIRLPENATATEKIHEINRMIFLEMQFKFPPHSLYAKDIDLYTFLPSVLDSRQGVCLGVSILYLCLAQRLDLPLEIITPPGHIYLRYREGNRVINIETTARGIDLPSETYLGINTRSLEQRTIKEVVGMAFFNQAGLFWGRGDYVKTVTLYETTQLFLPDDPLVSLFLGLNYLFIGKKKEGKQLLEKVRNITYDYAVSPESIPEDYLSGKVDAEGIKALFLHVDENRSSIVEKQQQLEGILRKHPKFRAGLLQLATTWMQLSRSKEAIETLEKHHAIDPNNCIVEYYLSMLSLMRVDYNHAWQYYDCAESLTSERDHCPRALKELKKALLAHSPPPS